MSVHWVLDDTEAALLLSVLSNVVEYELLDDDDVDAAEMFAGQLELLIDQRDRLSKVEQPGLVGLS